MSDERKKGLQDEMSALQAGIDASRKRIRQIKRQLDKISEEEEREQLKELYTAIQDRHLDVDDVLRTAEQKGRNNQNNGNQGNGGY